MDGRDDHECRFKNAEHSANKLAVATIRLNEFRHQRFEGDARGGTSVAVSPSLETWRDKKNSIGTFSLETNVHKCTLKNDPGVKTLKGLKR